MVLVSNVLVDQEVVEVDLHDVCAFQVELVSHPVYPVIERFDVNKGQLIIHVQVREDCLGLQSINVVIDFLSINVEAIEYDSE